MLEIGTDASPWGLGGWLARDGIIVEHFSLPVASADEEVISFPIGKQTWEALAILVALRLWQAIVLDKRVVLTITGALMLTSRMRPSTPSQAIIARELALFFGFRISPRHCAHARRCARRCNRA